MENTRASAYFAQKRRRANLNQDKKNNPEDHKHSDYEYAWVLLPMLFLFMLIIGVTAMGAEQPTGSEFDDLRRCLAEPTYAKAMQCLEFLGLGSP